MSNIILLEDKSISNTKSMIYNDQYEIGLHIAMFSISFNYDMH